MKIKQFLLSIEEIQIQSGFVDERPIHGQLAKTLSLEAMHVLLQIHPIVLVGTKKGRFQVVSGGSQLSLAKAILGIKAVIPVFIAEESESVALAKLVEQLIAPLFICPIFCRTARKTKRVRSFEVFNQNGSNPRF